MNTIHLKKRITKLRRYLLIFFHRKLRNNAFDKTLNMSSSISQQLQLIDLQDNNISFVTLGSGYKNTLM